MSNRPDWLKVRIPSGDDYFEVRRILRSHKLNTICEDAMCPNIAECWGKHRTATFMILGRYLHAGLRVLCRDQRTAHRIRFAGTGRVAAAIADLKLRHAVITSVDRDDLADGGALIFAETVREHSGEEIRDVKIELLTPDFQGSLDCVRTIIDAGPDIFSHNIETVSRLYPAIRFKSDYTTSFGLLKAAKAMSSEHITKTGIMVGLGENMGRDRRTDARCGRGRSRHLHDRTVSASVDEAC